MGFSIPFFLVLFIALLASAIDAFRIQTTEIGAAQLSEPADTAQALKKLALGFLALEPSTAFLLSSPGYRRTVTRTRRRVHPFMVDGPKSRRDALLTATLAAALAAVPRPGLAIQRPEGVDRPDLLPAEKMNVLDLQKFLTDGEIKRLEKTTAKLEADRKVKLRLITQRYPETPGSALKDYWNVDANTIVVVVDPGRDEKDIKNIIKFNVGENLDLDYPPFFFNKVKNTFGNSYFVKDYGKETAILRTMETLDYCVRDGSCLDVPAEFKDMKNTPKLNGFNFGNVGKKDPFAGL